MLNRFISFLIFSNLFIACCAAALTAEVFVLFQTPLNQYWFLLIIACGTLLVYNLHYLVKSNTSKTDNRLQWVRQNKFSVYLISSFTLLVLLWLVVIHYDVFFLSAGKLSVYKLLLFTGMPLMAVWYSHKIVPGVQASTREWPWTKTIYLAFVWTAATSLLPLFFVNREAIKNEGLSVVAFLLFQFVFVLGLCVLFNVKDAEEDKAEGLKTFAAHYGAAAVLRRGKWVILTVNLIAAAFFLIVYPKSTPLMWLALLLSIFLLWLLFHLFSYKKDIAVFALQYDGLMIVKASLLIFAKQFNFF